MAVEASLAMEHDYSAEEGAAVEEDAVSVGGFDQIGDRNVCESIISRYGNSQLQEHRHVCAVAEAVLQTIKSQNVPSENPTACFAAAMTSLEQNLDQNSSSSDVDDQVVSITAALCTFLSIVLCKVPPAVLKAKWEETVKTLVRVVLRNDEVAGVVRSGMKCISFLVCLGHKTQGWSAVAEAFGVVLRHVVDRRPKVRKCAQSCLADILRSYLGTPMLGRASEEVVSFFEYFLQKAGGIKPASILDKPPMITSNSNGAMEVLHMLNALKFTFSFLSKKVILKFLGHFKLLLQLQKRFLTRHVMNALHALSTNETADIPTNAFIELICWLCPVVLGDERSADDIYFATLVIRHGVKRIYDIDHNLCAAKLPDVFHALADLLALQHEAALLGASEALQHLIYNCINDDMISEGVDQVKLHGDARQSAPTNIERICTTAESLLGYQYVSAWDVSLQVVSALFDRLGDASFYLMGVVLKNLTQLQELDDEDLPSRKQLHKCIGSAVAAMGIESFMLLMPLGLDNKELEEASIWLLPIMKQYIIGSSLRFFKVRIVPMAERLKSKSKMLEEQGMPVASLNMQACSYSLWSLFPSFCNYPVDLKENFANLIETLDKKISEEPDLRGIICSGLERLIQQNKSAQEQKLDGPENAANSENSGESLAVCKAKSRYSSDLASQNLKVLSGHSPKILSVLFKAFTSSPDDKRGFLQVTIEEFASISETKVVQRFLRKILEMLNDITQKALSSAERYPKERAQLLDLAASLIRGLTVEALNVLFRVIKPAIQDEDGTVQKKAYKVLGSILKEHPNFLPGNFDPIFELMTASTPTSCHLSARRNRLICLEYVITHLLKNKEGPNDRIVSFISEILLGIKEANKKTRTCAYGLLVNIGHCLEDTATGGSNDKLQQFFKMLTGFLGATTTLMMSAAITGLARLIYEFSDLLALAPNLLPSIFMLLKTNNREIIKASLGFIKVIVARLQSEDLINHLKCLVDGLLLLEVKGKSRFKAKVRILLEMMIRKCGLEPVKAVMPEQHMKLLTNIRKVNQRKEKKSAMSQVGADEDRSSYSRATTRKSKWNHTDIFSDFGDEDDADSDEYMEDSKSIIISRTAKSIPTSKLTSRSRNLRKSKKRLAEDSIDISGSGPIDLLDKRRTRSLLKVGQRKEQTSDSDDEPDIAPDGRLVFKEDGQDGRKKKRAAADDELSEDAQTQRSKHTKSQAGSRSTLNAQQHKRQKTSKSGWAYTGSEYQSKKATGDVKREGKLEPYAYWPLDPKMLNRREEKRAVARKGLASVMKLTKKMQGKSVNEALALKSGNRKRKQKAHKGK